MLTVRDFAVFGCRGNDLEANDRRFGTADQFDHVVETPADHVDQLAAFSLADADDAIRRLQRAGFVRWSRRNETHHLGVVVFRTQHRADAFERQRHVDVEVLGRARREVLGVRIVGARVRVHVNLERVFAVGLRRLLQTVLVALRQHVLDLGDLLAVQLHAEHGRFQALAPQVVEFGGGRRPRRVLALHLDRLVGVEVHRLKTLTQFGDQEFQAFFEAHLIAIEDVERGVEIAALQRIVERIPILLQRLNIGREKVRVAAIQEVDVLVEEFARRRVIERLLQIVVVPQLLDDRQTRARVHVERMQRLRNREAVCRRCRFGRRRRCGCRRGRCVRKRGTVWRWRCKCERRHQRRNHAAEHLRCVSRRHT